MTNVYIGVIHLGDAGRGILTCRAPAKGRVPADMDANWTWKPALVTCKNCLRIYNRQPK